MKWPWVSRRRLEQLQYELDWTAQVLGARRREGRRRAADHLRQVQALTAEQRRLDAECTWSSERLGRAVELLRQVRPTGAFHQANLAPGWETDRAALLQDVALKEAGSA